MRLVLNGFMSISDGWMNFLQILNDSPSDLLSHKSGWSPWKTSDGVHFRVIIHEMIISWGLQFKIEESLATTIYLYVVKSVSRCLSKWFNDTHYLIYVPLPPNVIWTCIVEWSWMWSGGETKPSVILVPCWCQLLSSLVAPLLALRLFSSGNKKKNQNLLKTFTIMNQNFIHK